MQSDEVIWQVINHQFCSFKAKLARERSFCQNPYNVTGLCLRSACPLANSSYATIREIDGKCYLFTKTAERAHTPKKLWEKIQLPSDYFQALEIVSNHLEHFPKYLVHRNKQRLTKIHQMLIRMRKLRLQERPKIVTTSTKVDKRDLIRENKALKAAQIEKAIENELLERLRQVSETEIYNYPEKQYTKALNRAVDTESVSSVQNPRALASKLVDDNEENEEFDGNEEEVEVEYEDEEDLGEENYNIEYIENFDESEDEEEDIEDFAVDSVKLTSKVNSSKSVSFDNESADADNNRKRKAAMSDIAKSKVRSKGPRVEIEYENEEDASSAVRSFETTLNF